MKIKISHFSRQYFLPTKSIQEDLVETANSIKSAVR